MKTEIHYYEGTFEEVLEYNIKKGKPLLVFISDEQCEACTDLERKLAAAPRALNVLNERYINYKYRGEADNSLHLNWLLKKFSFPILILFNEHGSIQSVVPGVKEPELLVEYFELIKEAEFGEFEYFHPGSSLNSFYEDLYDLLNLTHSAWLQYRRGNYGRAKVLIEQAIEIEPYYYNLYLASKINEKLDIESEARFYAKETFKLYTSENCIIYSQLQKKLESYFDYADNREVTADYPVLTLKENTHDYGTLKHNEKATCMFSFTNTGTKPLVLINVDTGCTCTVFDWTKTPVMPGAEGELKVEYDTSKPGHFSKVLFLFSNGKIGTHKVMIKGRVLKN